MIRYEIEEQRDGVPEKWSLQATVRTKTEARKTCREFRQEDRIAYGRVRTYRIVEVVTTRTVVK